MVSPPAPACSLCERERLRQVFKYPLKAGARANGAAKDVLAAL